MPTRWTAQSHAYTSAASHVTVCPRNWQDRRANACTLTTRWSTHTCTGWWMRLKRVRVCMCMTCVVLRHLWMSVCGRQLLGARLVSVIILICHPHTHTHTYIYKYTHTGDPITGSGRHGFRMPTDDAPFLYVDKGDPVTVHGSDGRVYKGREGSAVVFSPASGMLKNNRFNLVVRPETGQGSRKQEKLLRKQNPRITHTRPSTTQGSVRSVSSTPGLALSSSKSPLSRSKRLSQHAYVPYRASNATPTHSPELQRPKQTQGGGFPAVRPSTVGSPVPSSSGGMLLNDPGTKKLNWGGL